MMQLPGQVLIRFTLFVGSKSASSVHSKLLYYKIFFNEFRHGLVGRQ